MSEQNIFKKHLGHGEEIEVEGDKFMLKHLTTDSLPDLLTAAKSFSGMKQDEDFIKNIIPDSMTAIKNLINKTLERSFPDEWKSDKDTLMTWGFKYMMVLLPKILEMNSSKDNTHEGIKTAALKDKISKLQTQDAVD